MGEFVEIASVGDLEDGGLRRIVIEGKAILLARAGDQYYAANDSCPHQGHSLAEGRLKGSVLNCAYHGARFDLADGSVLHWAGLEEKPPKHAKPFVTFEVRIENDRILASI